MYSDPNQLSAINAQQREQTVFCDILLSIHKDNSESREFSSSEESLSFLKCFNLKKTTSAYLCYRVKHKEDTQHASFTCTMTSVSLDLFINYNTQYLANATKCIESYASLSLGTYQLDDGSS
jgi:hypothetical protein